MYAILPGLLTGFSIITAIGAQNLFVIRQGLARENVFIVAVVCSISDVILIIVGVSGLGKIIGTHKNLLEFIRWFGVAFLLFYAFRTFAKVLGKNDYNLKASTTNGVIKCIINSLVLSFFNPHVLLDNVFLIGGISTEYKSNKWYFALGAMQSCVFWLFFLGFGAMYFAKYIHNRILWKILDSTITVVLISAAIFLAFHKFN